MLITGPAVVSELPFEVARKVLKRLNRFNRANWVNSVQLDWLEDARRAGLVKKMSRLDQNENLDSVYQASKSEGLVNEKLRDRAADTYMTLKKNCQ